MPSNKIAQNPRRPVPVHRLLDVFNQVFMDLQYTREERAMLWGQAKCANPKSYACYQAILNSRSHEDADGTH